MLMFFVLGPVVYFDGRFGDFFATAGLSAHTPSDLNHGPVSAAIPVAKGKILLLNLGWNESVSNLAV